MIQNVHTANYAFRMMYSYSGKLFVDNACTHERKLRPGLQFRPVRFQHLASDKLQPDWPGWSWTHVTLNRMLMRNQRPELVSCVRSLRIGHVVQAAHRFNIDYWLLIFVALILRLRTPRICVAFKLSSERQDKMNRVHNTCETYASSSSLGATYSFYPPPSSYDFE